MTVFAFFVGTNGSGTTLHRAIFDSHPNLAIPGESQFITKLQKRRDVYEAGNGFDTDLFIADLEREHRFGNWGMPSEQLEQALSDPSPADYPDAIRKLYAGYAAGQGKSRYGDKTQAYIHDLPVLARLFPEARFVHAVRDGRDVALAHTSGEKMEQVALSWKRRVSAGVEAGRALGPARYYESRFEELIDDTEGAVRRICDFIELDFDPQMLRYYERADEVIATTAAPDRHKDIHKPPTKGLQDWRRQLSPNQVMRFETIAGDVLDQLGYERAYDVVPLKGRLSAWAHLSADGARLLWKRARKRMGSR